MSPICPVYPKQQTFLDPVGTSHLCQEPTLAVAKIADRSAEALEAAFGSNVELILAF
jgi:hypothetical protein